MLGALGRLFGIGGGEAAAPAEGPESGAQPAAAPAQEAAGGSAPAAPSGGESPPPAAAPGLLAAAPPATPAPEEGRVVVLQGTREKVTAGPEHVLSGEGGKIRALLNEAPVTSPQAAPAGAVPPVALEAPARPAQDAATPAPAPEAIAAVAGPSFTPLDLNASDSVASAVVLVVTPGGSGTGVVLDEGGRVLTNWHVVAGHPDVAVLFRRPDGDAAATDSVYTARVVRINRASDLALLELTARPPALRSVELAGPGAVRPGEVVHALGHPRGAVWRDTPATVSTVDADASWYSGGNVLHRGEIVKAQIRSDPGDSGTPLLDANLRLVGISAHTDRRTHQVVAVSADTIRRFLGSGQTRAAAASGG